MIDQNQVSIIIPHLGATKEQEYSLNQCFQSLKETCDIDIIVAKNGGMNCKHECDINIFEQGQCKAVNAAVATTSTPWVLVTNDDMIYPPGWFEKLTSREHPCLCPKLIEPRPGAPTFQVYFCGGAGGDFQKEKFLEFAKTYYGVGIRTGFNMPLLIKRDLWDMVGGYDVNYDPWGSNSDSDLEYKIKLAGVQPMQQTDAIVYHFSQTSGTFEPQNQGYWNRNFAYFQEKWGFPRTDNRIWEADFVIPKESRKFRPWWEGKYV